MERLANENACYDFSGLLSVTNINTAYELFSNIIEDKFKECCPLKHKTFSYKRIMKPWITDSILSNIKKRQAYLLLYRQNKIPQHVYNRFRNLVTSQIRYAKRAYYLAKFDSFKKNTKLVWGELNKILKSKNTSREKLECIMMNDTKVDSDNEIANVFNDYFSTI